MKEMSNAVDRKKITMSHLLHLHIQEGQTAVGVIMITKIKVVLAVIIITAVVILHICMRMDTVHILMYYLPV